MTKTYIDRTVVKPSIATVKRALETFGHIRVTYGDGKTRDIREIVSVNGFWEFARYHDDRGVLRAFGYKQRAQKLWITQVAQGWLNAKEEILADRERDRAAFWNR